MQRYEVDYSNDNIVPPSIQLITHIIIHVSFESTEKEIVNTTVEEISYDASSETVKKSHVQRLKAMQSLFLLRYQE
jgi:hypothetical protein